MIRKTRQNFVLKFLFRSSPENDLPERVTIAMSGPLISTTEVDEEKDNRSLFTYYIYMVQFKRTQQAKNFQPA